MSKFHIPVQPVLPSSDSVASRRTVLRGAAGLGLGLGVLGASFGAAAQNHDHGTPVPGTLGTPEATPGAGGYVGSDATTQGDTGSALPIPGEIQQFAPRNPFLTPVTPGPKTLNLSCRDATVYIARDTPYAGWSFNGTIPGTIFRAVEGDMITASISNDAPMAHSVDFHSARVAADKGYKVLLPGEKFEWTYQAQYPGAYMYHCGTAPVLMHIGAGMYSAIIVDPKEGWAPAQELCFVQSEFYVKDGPNGIKQVDTDKLFSLGTMDYVAFNGYANLYVENPIIVKARELVRIFVVNAGPNIWSSFHVVGAIFDKVYLNANPKNVMHGMQGVSIGPGDGACVELMFDEPGEYVAVNHSFGHAAHGAVAVIHAI